MQALRTLSAVAVLMFAVSACGGSSGNPSAEPGQQTPSHGQKARGSASPTPLPSPTDIPPNGRDIGYLVTVDHTSGKPYLEFDRVLFLTGDDANEAAAEHDDETPVPNDYYIVNDNDIIRTFPIAPHALVVKANALGCPPDSCSKEERQGKLGDLEAWLDTHPDDAKRVPFNLRYDADGRIDRIEEIYLP